MFFLDLLAAFLISICDLFYPILGDNLNQTPRELHAWLGGALQNSNVRILNAPLHNTSSTQIRQTLQSGRLSDDLPWKKTKKSLHLKSI